MWHEHTTWKSESPGTETAQLHSPYGLCCYCTFIIRTIPTTMKHVISGDAENKKLGTKERIKSLLAPKAHCRPASGIHLLRPRQVMSNTCVAVCASAAKRSANLYRAPLPTSMIAGIFRWLQSQLNAFPLSSCWAADEMTAGDQDGQVNYEQN